MSIQEQHWFRELLHENFVISKIMTDLILRIANNSLRRCSSQCNTALLIWGMRNTKDSSSFTSRYLLKHIPHQANRTCQLSLSNGNMVESTKVRTEAYKDAYIPHSIGA